MLTKNHFQKKFQDDYTNVTKLSIQLLLSIFLGFSSCDKNKTGSDPGVKTLSSTPLANITRLEYYPTRYNEVATNPKRIPDKVTITFLQPVDASNPNYSGPGISSVVYFARADTLGLAQQNSSTEIQVGSDTDYHTSFFLEAALANTPLYDPAHIPEAYLCGKVDGFVSGSSLRESKIILTSENGERMVIMSSCEASEFLALNPMAPRAFAVSPQKYGFMHMALETIAPKLNTLLP